jgi:hypothetical protein
LASYVLHLIMGHNDIGSVVVVAAAVASVVLWANWRDKKNDDA